MSIVLHMCTIWPFSCLQIQLHTDAFPMASVIILELPAPMHWQVTLSRFQTVLQGLSLHIPAKFLFVAEVHCTHGVQHMGCMIVLARSLRSRRRLKTAWSAEAQRRKAHLLSVHRGCLNALISSCTSIGCVKARTFTCLSVMTLMSHAEQRHIPQSSTALSP